MKCPIYIQKALERRMKAAKQFNYYDAIVSTYIDKHGLEVDPCDYHGGVESVVHPESSYQAILEAIQKK